VGCLDGKTGQKLWFCDCGGPAASDPLWCRGRLFVLTLGPAGGQFVSPLCLVELNPETGDVLSRQPILEMALREKLPWECQVSWTGNRLVILLAGNVISFDLQARIDWLRQETTLPSAIDPAFVHQYCQPAINSNGRLFVQQPGSCAIDCLATETGQRRWRRGIIGLQQIIDLPDDRLLARTARGLVAVSKTSGEVLWQREFPGMLSALARTSAGLILCARQAMIADKPQILFLWIDMATGQTRAHGSVALEKNQPIFLGPIAARGDRTWCCFGYGAANESPAAANSKRIIELRPGKPAVADEAP
jgi:outer membrane protein assembly factor BamB